jgi:hypothetical protein
MTKFIKPSIGSKIAEFNITYYKQLSWDFSLLLKNFNHGLIIGFRLSLMLILPVALGVFLIIDPFNPNWLNWTVVGLLTIWSLLVIISMILNWINPETKPSDITILESGRKFSLFLVRNGIEINSTFIPFKTINNSISTDNQGIVGFKLDGNTLYIQTKDNNHYLLLYRMKYENEIPFTLEAQYLEQKQELLDYLNSQINKYEE